MRRPKALNNAHSQGAWREALGTLAPAEGRRECWAAAIPHPSPRHKAESPEANAASVLMHRWHLIGADAVGGEIADPELAAPSDFPPFTGRSFFDC